MKIIEMSEEAILEQVIEEAGELVQAAAKRLRILRGESPTPVTLKDNFGNLIEEMADVRLCIDVTTEKLMARHEVAEMYREKEERWENRLKNK